MYFALELQDKEMQREGGSVALCPLIGEYKLVSLRVCTHGGFIQ